MQKQYWLIVIASFFWAGNGTSANAQIMVSVRGDCDAEDIQKRAEFYAHHFRIEENVYLQILFTHKIEGDKIGYIQFTNGNDVRGVKQAIIKINRKASRNEQLVALAHEMVHLQQFLEGKLCKYSDFHYSWMGQTYPDIRKIAYHKRAWEIEARSLELELFRLYKTSDTPLVLSTIR